VQPYEADPKRLAKRMMELGSEAVAAAIGGMNAVQSAMAMEFLPPQEAANILCLARPQCAAMVGYLVS